MVKKAAAIIAIALACLLLVLAICTAVPRLKAGLFVHLYHGRIEEGVAAGGALPASDALFFRYKAFNWWAGEHPMLEFVLSAWGSTYYGCYYSPDGVPLAFQNTAVELLPNGSWWEWSAGGDNHGSTRQIAGNWFYFKASF